MTLIPKPGISVSETRRNFSGSTGALRESMSFFVSFVFIVPDLPLFRENVNILFVIFTFSLS